MANYESFKKAQAKLEEAILAIVEKYDLSNIEIANLLSPITTSYQNKAREDNR